MPTQGAEMHSFPGQEQQLPMARMNPGTRPLPDTPLKRPG